MSGRGELEVLRAGSLTTVQDLGRPGWAHLGVPRAGALDPPALTRGNLLVANPPDTAGLEITLTGCRLRLTVATLVAVTGARVSRLRVDGQAVEPDTPVPVPAGAVVEVGPARSGVRTYLAVAGGIAVAPVLGSRSTDTLSGLGPPVLRDGDLLPLAVPDPRAAPDPDATPAQDRPAQDRPAQDRPATVGSQVVLRVRLGPRQDWFTAAALDALTRSRYTVSTRSNRVAARLDGPPLERVSAGELPSEGIVLGAVQVPAGGQPLVFLADHPTTGGYPVIAVVDPTDLPLLGQCRPGAAVRFDPLE